MSASAATAVMQTVVASTLITDAISTVLTSCNCKGPSTLATLFNHMWPRIVAGIFIPVGNHYFQALASTLQFVAQVCDRLWLVPATDRAFAYITYMSPPHVALVCSGPPQCTATCGWTKWPVCSGPNWSSERRSCSFTYSCNKNSCSWKVIVLLTVTLISASYIHEEKSKTTSAIS